MNQELLAVIMPGGSIRLEWARTEDRVDQSQDLLQQEIYERFSSHPDRAFLFLGFCNRAVSLSPSLDYLRGFFGLFAKKLLLTPDLEAIKHEVRISLGAEELDHALISAPMMTGAEYLSRELLEDLWQRLHAEFRQQIKQHKGTVEEFIQSYSPDVHLIGRVFFHLVESKKDDYPFAFLATYSTGLNKQGKTQHLPLKHALEEYGRDSRKLLDLLATVHRAAKESTFIAERLENGELFHPLAWSAREAHTFLQEIPLYEQSGILCRIPNWWKGNSSSLQVRVAMGDRAPSSVGMDALLSFDIRLYIEDTPISLEEARRLLECAEGLTLIKNRWVAVDPEKLKQTLEVYEKARKTVGQEGLTFREALRFHLNPKSALAMSETDAAVTVTNGQWLESVIAKMRHPDKVDSVKLSPAFKAELRPYQQQGVRWLSFLHSLKFGMCLADDMGLGKTVQVLALLHSLKTSGEKGASLLVIPASLLANWADEITRFAPDITFYTAHPAGNDSGRVAAKTAGELDALDLVITTYALVQKYEWLQTHKWKYVILDEAQAIRNPGTRQT
ncbi:MAG: ATP-dependent helicase, partial [Acidobacteria bacterium]|nr:ATP-dependent helicase [Acidobacteriota bacterium]